ncbi:MAG: hypothetical protein JWO87_2081, partial [Phycisphaerales bacterium]|nr:hypothetical protein [Phycisphaerales bacterium]
LEKLNQDVYADEVFLKCRDMSHQLQTILKHVCFEVASPLRDFMLEYGVF